MSDEALPDIMERGGVTVVGLDTAAITTAGVEPIAQSLRDLISKQQPRQVVVDFTRVRFISSMMLGLLVDLWRRMKEYGGQLCIAGIDPQLNRVFRITHLDKIFRFCPDVETAVRSFENSESEPA